ncbi:MAG: 5-oxoprolinase subunit PxpA [Thermoanaerobaculia bacterium]|jgi:UPF0271 protein
MTPIDVSCDLGEAATADDRETELALWPLVDAANVACGGHAGDDASMRAAAALARRHAVRLGAHPSFPDREGFGRRRIDICETELVASLVEQIRSLRAIAEEAGVELERVKAHGALYNVAYHDEQLARRLVDAVIAAAPRAALVCPSGSAMERVAAERSLSVVREAFADRRYLPDGSLLARGHAQSLLTEPADAAAQALSLAKRGIVTALDGSEITIPHDTICIHADMPGAVARLRTIRSALSSAGLTLRRPS